MVLSFYKRSLKRGKRVRDINRIDPFLEKIGELWKRVPDWRFGQLMFNFLSEYGDPFYLSEDEFLKKLDKYLS